jgi:Zn-dependent oligopeptidase
MNNLNLLHMDSDKRLIEINLYIKKSRNMRNNIKTKQLNNNKIMEILFNDIYEFNNLLSISILGIYLYNYDSWKNINKILNTYNEEYYQDYKLYEIINKLNTTDTQSEYAIKYIINKFKKNGCHLNNRLTIFELNNQIEEIKDKINNDILCDKLVLIENNNPIINNKYLTKFIINENNKNYFKMNKKIVDIINASSKLDNTTKNSVNILYKKWSFNTTNDLFKLIKLRNDLAKISNYNAYYEYANINCMNHNNIEIIRNLVIGLDKTVRIELDNLFKFTNGTISIDQFNELNYDDFKKIILQQKNILLNKIGFFNLYKSFDLILKIFSKIFKLKITLVKNTFFKWSNNVKLYSLYDTDNTQLGYIYIDLDYNEQKKCSPTCVNIMKYANYPLNSDNYILPITSLIANLHSEITYYDIVSLTHELTHSLHCLMGRNKYCVINGIVCEDDFIEIPGILIEKIMWEKNNIIQFLNINNKSNELVDDVIKLNNIETSIVLKNKCSIALFDQFIHSSNQFIEICKNIDNKELFDTLNNIYKNIVSQVMNDIEPCNTWINYDITTILSFLEDNAGMLSNILISDIIASNIYNKCYDDTFFYKFKNTILNNYKLNNMELLKHLFIYEPKLVHNNDIIDDFSIVNDNGSFVENDNSDTNYFDITNNNVSKKINLSLNPNKSKNIFASK